ncbi:Uncharacterized protein FWK35_00038057, partial [Aphis craccivora]
TSEEKAAREQRLAVRAKTNSLLNRECTINRIKALAETAARVNDNLDLLPGFLIAAGDLDSLWTSFVSHNQDVLDALLDLDLTAEFSTQLETEVRSLYVSVLTVVEQHSPQQETGSLGEGDGNGSRNDVPASTSVSRLPEIPLPSFSGDLIEWPVFRDRFLARVGHIPNLPNIDRFYYLLGCLKGDALYTIKNIAVTENTYNLAWSTLFERYDKPRQLASLIVDKLISVQSQSQESLDGLKQFLILFSDQVAMLKSLNIPDLGEFILFALSVRGLSLSTRKGFEAANSCEFPLVSDLVTYVKSRVAVLETVTQSSNARSYNQPQDKTKPIHRPENKKSKVALLASHAPVASTSKCLFCSGEHSTVKCVTFSDMSLDDRYQAAKDRKICFRCLNSTHWSNRCLAKACSKCKGRHHILLHRDFEASSKPSSSTDTTAVHIGSLDRPNVLLGTALIHVRDYCGRAQPIRALIDSASQVSVMTLACADRLGLKRSQWTTPITGLSGVQVPKLNGVVKCTIAPRYDDNTKIQVTAWVLPTITTNMPSRHLPKHCKHKFSHLALADPSFDLPAPVELLLGADVFSQILDGKRVVIDNSLPTAFGSLFGWILIGPVPDHEPDRICSNVVSLTVSLENLVERFWRVEEPDPAPVMFTDEGKCETIYLTERVRDDSGRFVVPLPFMESGKEERFLGSRQMALRRFQNLERKLQANPALNQAYSAFMSDYESLGHMSIASSHGDYFIPHHPVFKGDVANSKIRVVFDASATTSSNRSLNQCLFTGPKLQQDIVDIMLRFRVHQFTFTADVCKMYRQILVLPQYRKYQHIFWRASPLDELKEYQLNTVTYGVNCAPYLALRVLKDLADNCCEELPDVKQALTHQTYVDDICVGADSTDQLLTLRADLQSVLSTAGFELKKWSSNDPKILATIPQEDRVQRALQFDDPDDGLVKVLGLNWDSSEDTFGFEVSPSCDVMTKRAVLSTIARIFDPIGLIAPVIFYAKHILQKIWKAGLAWDTPLPSNLAEDWKTFVQDLHTLTKIKIPRFLATTTGSHVQLCGFCDASEQGYAAIVYLRLIKPDGSVSISLLGSKTKMSPMKKITVPRLELSASVLLARWMARIKATLEHQLVITNVFAWSDSQIVLSWLINPHSLFKIFVSNRVHQVHILLPSCKWGYVRTDDNPADCASRGLQPSALMQFPLYWYGPQFLRHSEESWDLSPCIMTLEELPETKGVSLAVQIDTDDEWFTRFSSYTNMLRVVTWMRRFIGLCQGKTYSNAFLCQSELTDSLTVLVKASQLQTLGKLLHNLQHDQAPPRTFAVLRPFIDPCGVIRVGGRLAHADLTVSQKQPILLSKTSYLSLLIVRHWHLVTCHSGPRVITALIARQFWIASVRCVIRKVIGSCTICVRAIARTPTPLMADLPAVRVQACRPFSRVGIDYAGPLPMRECRLRKARQYKVYVAVFVCMAVKAVHLEVVLDLTTDAFLAALDRFVARRGLPHEIFSDCGTNFVGASKQLRQLVNNPDNYHRISSHFSCTWIFNPPSAPHFGGLWEAAVRSFKTLLTRVMGTHNPSPEELSTILCRIEAILNSRPLTPMSSSPLDLDYLSPGHFLIGQPLLAVPERHIPEDNRKIVNRWKLLHQSHQSFWRRWSSEYLCSLQARTKWTNDVPNLKDGDMVVIKDNQSPPTAWRLGRVLSVMPGADGVVRVARVLTVQGELTRPVVKLVLLPTE